LNINPSYDFSLCLSIRPLEPDNGLLPSILDILGVLCHSSSSSALLSGNNISSDPFLYDGEEIFFSL